MSQKDVTQEQADGRGVSGSVRGEGEEARALSGSATVPILHVSTSREALPTRSCVFLRRLHYLVLIDYIMSRWRLNQPRPLSPFWRSEGEVQPSNHVIGSLGNRPPTLGASKSHLIHVTRLLYHAPHSGNSEGSGSCEPGTVDEDRIYLFHESQYPGMQETSTE